MEPLDAIPPSAWRAVKGVATDLDDTLTVHGRLTASSLAALDTLSAMDLPCVIATGRPVGWAEVLAGLLPVRAVVAENGGAWAAREGAAARVTFMEDDGARDEGLQRSRAMARRVSERFPTLQPVREHVLRATDVTLDVGERVSVPRALVEEALAMVRAGGLHGVASTVHLHISHRAPDKTAGLRAALTDVGLDAGELDGAWLYLGDSPNDAGPFAAMALAVGVRGVERLPMPALPKFVCRAGAGEALAELVDALRRHRGDA